MHVKLANGQRATDFDVMNMAHMLLAIAFTESTSKASILEMAQKVGLSLTTSELYLQTLTAEKYVSCEDGQILLCEDGQKLIEQEVNKLLLHRAEMN